jgi:hypothetical protein
MKKRISLTLKPALDTPPPLPLKRLCHTETEGLNGRNKHASSLPTGRQAKL